MFRYKFNEAKYCYAKYNSKFGCARQKSQTNIFSQICHAMFKTRNYVAVDQINKGINLAKVGRNIVLVPSAVSSHDMSLATRSVMRQCLRGGRMCFCSHCSSCYREVRDVKNFTLRGGPQCYHNLTSCFRRRPDKKVYKCMKYELRRHDLYGEM